MEKSNTCRFVSNGWNVTLNECHANTPSVSPPSIPRTSNQNAHDVAPAGSETTTAFADGFRAVTVTAKEPSSTVERGIAGSSTTRTSSDSAVTATALAGATVGPASLAQTSSQATTPPHRPRNSSARCPGSRRMACSISWRTRPPSSTALPPTTIRLAFLDQYPPTSPLLSTVLAPSTWYQCIASSAPVLPEHDSVIDHQRAYTAGGVSGALPAGSDALIEHAPRRMKGHKARHRQHG